VWRRSCMSVPAQVSTAYARRLKPQSSTHDGSKEHVERRDVRHEAIVLTERQDEVVAAARGEPSGPARRVRARGRSLSVICISEASSRGSVRWRHRCAAAHILRGAQGRPVVRRLLVRTAVADSSGACRGCNPAGARGVQSVREAARCLRAGCRGRSSGADATHLRERDKVLHRRGARYTLGHDEERRSARADAQ